MRRRYSRRNNSSSHNSRSHSNKRRIANMAKAANALMDASRNIDPTMYYYEGNTDMDDDYLEVYCCVRCAAAINGTGDGDIHDCVCCGAIHAEV